MSKRNVLDIQLDDILTLCNAFGAHVKNGGQKHLKRKEAIQNLHLLQNGLIFECDAHAHEVQHTADEFPASRCVLQLPVHPVPPIILD
jgi:hypothetical protein